VADAVRAALEGNEGDLSPYLEEVETLIEERDKLLQTNAQPCIQLVREHEEQEAFRSCTQDWLRKVLGKTTQQEIERFLSDYWLRVMQAAYLDGGASGARWKECDETIDLLLWSIKPRQSAEERRKLVGLIPLLLKRINAGLDQLGISSQERTPFLNSCFKLQTAALRKGPEAPETPAPTTAEQLMAPFPFIDLRTAGAIADRSDQLLERNGKLVQYLGLPADAQGPWRSAASPWKEGDWISFELPDGERLCGRHCGQMPSSGTILLFNSEWGYAVALAPSLLELQRGDGRARLVSESSLFDEAAERALDQVAPH
jgi:hypothetical protein